MLHIRRSKNPFSLLVCFFLFFVCLQTSNAGAQEASNIYIGKLNFLEEKVITDLSAITQTASYTNQPYFFSEHELYYTQAVANASGDKSEQMDTFLYNVLEQSSTNLTNSKESEYSPTPLPSRKGFSVIRVNEAGKQELWSYNKEGEALKHLVPTIEPVGYQVWLNKDELLLFVLGEPNTLQRVDTREPLAKGQIIDNKIGASLFRFQQSDWFLYTRQHDTNKAPMLKAYNASTRKVVDIGSLPENSQYFSVSATGHLLTSDTLKLHHKRLTISGGKPVFKGPWTQVVVGNEDCQSGISRTAISNFGDRVALVCESK
uniref:hypothetical protein n=1 Tax=Ningiella ruwaisensis TaxID=2364274 RepID=UPI00109FB426|nr:hypothetical protein [Ningiella ruwaisensis]